MYLRGGDGGGRAREEAAAVLDVAEERGGHPKREHERVGPGMERPDGDGRRWSGAVEGGRRGVRGRAAWE